MPGDDFWGLVTSVDDDLFYGRDDPNDIRLGEVVGRNASQYDRAEVVVVGCPEDEGVRRNRGRTGARFAPTEIRRALYRYAVSESHQNIRLFDLGNVKIQASLEGTHDNLYQIVRRLVKDGKTVIALGGGNDMSYPDCAALAAETNRLLVLNIDRHLDVRTDEPRNSGTPYRQLLDEGLILPGMFHEVGTNSFTNSLAYRKYLEAMGAHIHYLGDVREKGVGATVRAIAEGSNADGIFFGFDLDVVRAVEAPGVSDPYPMGLTAMQVCEIADVAAADPRTRIVELTEVNPTYDMGGITSKLAANIIVRSIARPGSVASEDIS